MEDNWIFTLVFFGLGLWVLGLVLAVIALSKISGLGWQLKTLRERVTKLDEVVVALIKRRKSETASGGVPASTAAEPPVEQTIGHGPNVEGQPHQQPVTGTTQVAPVAESSVRVISAAANRKPARAGNFEGQLASRWFVWIGAAAVALGGLLFVRYAAEHQLVPPILRIALGLILGAALVGAGEYLRRTKTAAGTYIPAGLASGGIVTAFGSVYAAHVLYGLLGPTTAFVGLGLIAIAALALSSLRGPLIAAVGLFGSYLTPALVVSHDPQALGLFIYLVVVLAACFAVLRKRAWDWLGYLSLFGAASWAWIWVLGGAFHIGDVPVVGLFCFAMAAVAAFSLEGRSVFSAEAGSLLNVKTMSRGLRFALMGSGLAMAVLSAQVFESLHSQAAMLFFAIGVAGVATFGWQRHGNSFAAPLAAGLSWLVIMGWDVNDFSTQLSGEAAFAAWSLSAMIGFGLLGAAGFLRKSPDVIWASLAAAAPVTFLFGMFALAPDYLLASNWALLAFAAAAAQIILASFKKGDELAPALLLAGAALLAIFAFDRLTHDIWLTLLIAGLAVAYALSSRIFATRHIGLLAGLLATLAELRLFVRHSGFANSEPLPWGQHWPLYGYGLPALGFWWASRILANDKYRRYRIALEGLSLGLVITLASLEIRAFIASSDGFDHLTLLEMGAHVCAWLGAAYGLSYRQTLYSSLVSTWGARALLGLSAVGLLLGCLLTFNPLVDHTPLEGGAILNSLILAYLVPCILLGLLAQKLAALGLEKLRIGIGALALLSLLAYVTFALKRLFEGAALDIEFASDAESYAISFCWMALAVAFFVAGLQWNRTALRYGGVAVMMLALLKTFGYDLWKLGGLWQIASVMGIGLSLVGVSWLYARFMRTGAANPAS